MSSLWSAAATNEGIFAKGFSTARKKRARTDKEVPVKSAKKDDGLAKMFKVKDGDNYLEDLDNMRQHIIDLLNVTHTEFNLDDFGGA
jgi:hypothetical protein